MRNDGRTMTKEAAPGSEVFDNLVSALSGQERQDMLSRIRFSQVVEEAPLREPELSPEARFDQLYAGLTFFERLLLFLRSVLTGRDRVLLVGEVALRRIGRALAVNAQDSFISRTLELRAGFFDSLERLREAVALFRRPLREALGGYKKDFIAFLAGVEMPIVQEHLMRQCDPVQQDHAITDLSEFDMKRTLDADLQDAFEEISETERQTMYRDMQLLHWLKDLSDFGFDRIIARAAGAAGAKSCPAATVIAALKDLAAVLSRLSVPPTTQLVGVLFLFAVRERIDEEGFDLEADLEREIAAARDALGEIRRFNATVALHDMIRLVLKDPDWMPFLRGGGEDWFLLYKQFWSERLEERVSDFCRQRKRSELLEEAIRMLRLADLPYLRNYRSDPDEGTLRFAHEHSLAFLRGFLEQVYSKVIGRPVRIFLLDGKFYKEQNRKDFSDACTTIDRLLDRIRAFEREMSESGELGRQIAETRAENGLPTSRAKALASASKRADRDAETLLLEGKRSLELLQLVLEGILHGQGEETYDTISNRGQIGGRDNGRLLAALRVGVDRLSEGNRLLGGLVALEEEASG